MPPGKKECKECGKLVGPRTKVCPECGCKFVFKTGSQSKKIKGVKQAGFSPPQRPATSVVVGVNDREALDTFLAQLRACRDDSNRNGGCYSAFLHCRAGDCVQVEVQLRRPEDG